MKIIALLALVVIITPFLGIPVFWKTIVFVVSGTIILIKTLKNSNSLNKKLDFKEIEDSVYTESGDDYKE
ncbi:MAG: hypothetical protein KAR54_01905 [Candidatus Pacebacteria bacterium]|nr:hypothetical protein [Candidatus Paceibacterota bacterium]